MKTILLTRGKSAMVDDEDYPWLSEYKWQCAISKNTWYAKSNSTLNHRLTMHRVIMNVPNELEVDHIDGDGLNNQKSNLRVCTNVDNGRNKGMSRANTSGFKGVQRHPHKHQWRADIRVNWRLIYLGLFPTSEEAAHACDTAAVKYFGSFARTNAQMWLL